MAGAESAATLHLPVGTSQRWPRDLDPEEARGIIDPALELMIEAVRRYDGYIVQSTGDGIFALRFARICG